MSQHQFFMDRALALAIKGEGETSPNPCVGAVIVRDGRIVGEGYHRRAGSLHAEAEALQSAGDLARGATLYVTLEPCNHEGRTPPCTDAILKAGVAEVYYSLGDPNPGVTGRGHERLAKAGVIVHRGLCAVEVSHLNRFYLHHIRTGRPWVIAKYASSLDGKIATRTGDSRWITGSDARKRVHALRCRIDAILIGAGTAIADNPELTARTPGYTGGQPLRIVLDSTGRVPIGSRLFDSDLPGRTLVATTEAMSESHRNALEEKGIDVLSMPAHEGSRVDISSLLDRIGEQEISSVLVEGGAEVLGSCFDARVVQEVWAFFAPAIIGGREAPGPVHGVGFPALSNALRVDESVVEEVGEDYLIRGYIKQNA